MARGADLSPRTHRPGNHKAPQSRFGSGGQPTWRSMRYQIC